jgi:hypothetical protein
MLEKGPWGIIGEDEGEKEKFCWKGPAEVMIGSFSILNVSSGNGAPGWFCWLATLAVLAPSSEYSCSSASRSSSFGTEATLLTAGT